MAEFDEDQLVFVYGTLMQAHGNNRLLDNAVFKGQRYTMSSNYIMYSHGIPYVNRVDDTDIRRGKVRGELYLVPAQDMSRLDGLEHHPEWYCRELIELEDGSMAWCYLNTDADVCDGSNRTDAGHYEF